MKGVSIFIAILFWNNAMAQHNSIPHHENNGDIALVSWKLTERMDPVFASQGKMKLTYYPNGGTGEKVEFDYLKGDEVVLLSSVDGFVKEGFLLNGWSTSPDGTGAGYNLGDKIKVEDNLTLYAQWVKGIPGAESVSATIERKESVGPNSIIAQSGSSRMPKPKSDITVGGYPSGSVPKYCNLSIITGGSIYYTVDGSNPTRKSALYKGPLSISPVGTTIIKAIAVRDGYAESDIAILDFGPLFGGNEWADPQRFAVNREDPRATFYPYVSEEEAIQNHNLNPESSPYYKSLDGLDWRFKWVRKPYDRNSENGLIPNGVNYFAISDFDDSAWDIITVPSCWTVIRDTSGKFKYDGPGYSPAGYIWNAAFLGNTGAGAPLSPLPPQTNQSTTSAADEIKADIGTNSVGTYRKSFTIDKNWNGREVFINFTGVSSNCYVWVNGNPVGYAEDSWTNKEFNITPYLKAGKNVLAVQVFRWCDGSWIEDQDMNRHAGIFRSVYLVSRPKVCIGDFEVHTSPVIENNYNERWNLDVKVLLREFGIDLKKLNDTRLYITLYDAKGKRVGTTGGKSFVPHFTVKENILGDKYSGADLDFTIKVDKPKLWSAENPYLYKLVLTLRDDNNILESTCIRIGFREIKLVGNNTPDARVLLNGSRILLHGTNVHELDADKGYTVTKEMIRKDLTLMKLNNINSIRMSHYPHHEYYYELCDEYGIYVMDEANLECHGSRETNVNPDLQDMMQDRERNMFELDKNHASVVFWSTGNENYEGPDEELLTNFRKNCTQWFRDRDLSKRPVHQSFDNAGADFFGTGYQYPADLEKTILALNTPMLQTEYSHNQGNSFGVLHEYIEFFENQPKAMGGFIWDWVDQELRTPIVENGHLTGKSFLGFGTDWSDLALGGWWRDPSSMSNMGCNGMVLADRTPKPQVVEMKRQYQMLNAGLVDRNTFYISNKFLFTNANEFNMEWELLEDGKVIQSSKKPLLFDVQPAPGGVAQTTMSTMRFSVPFKMPKVLKPGAEYFFNVTFRTKQDTEWAPSGYAISENQMPVDFGQGDLPAVSEPGGTIRVDQKDTISILVTGENFLLVIDRSNGLIKSFKAKNALGELREMLVSGPIPNFFRSPVDGEREAVNMVRSKPTQAQMFMLWKDASKQRTTSFVQVNEESHKVVVMIEGIIPVLGPGKNNPSNTSVKYYITYTIYPDGETDVAFKYVFPTLAPENTYVAEIGSIMSVKGDFENLTWYGRGPGETYVNRKSGNDVGIWGSTVTDKAFLYPSTQETGNNVETRWFALTDDSGFGLIVKGEPIIDFNAIHYSPEELAKSFDPKYSPLSSKWHPYQVPVSPDTYLRVIYKGTGVGGINSWGKTPLPQYRINASEQTYCYRFSVLPIAKLSIDQAMDYWKTRYSDK